VEQNGIDVLDKRDQSVPMDGDFSDRGGISVARLNIPAGSREGLIKLLTLRAESFDQFIAGLQAQPATLDLPSQVTQTLTIPDVSKADLDQIISAVLSVCLVRWMHNVSLDTLVKDLSEAIQSFNPVGGSDESKQRLLRIMNVEPLAIASKALTIFTDYQRTLHGSKVLSDVRFVFRPEPEQEPYGAVIVHLLKLSYHEDGDHKEFFVAMDDTDVSRLKAVLIRAEKKARTLRRKLDAAQTAYLGATRRNEERGNE
jgi:hypothetical protein